MTTFINIRQFRYIRHRWLVFHGDEFLGHFLATPPEIEKLEGAIVSSVDWDRLVIELA
jgi:hypothetical protein